ncbi:hypothetical protein JCM10450v2_004611 [Rhodotorula kratochvilovae]
MCDASCYDPLPHHHSDTDWADDEEQEQDEDQEDQDKGQEQEEEEEWSESDDEDEVVVSGLREQTPEHWTDPPFSIDCRNLPYLPDLPDDWEDGTSGGHFYAYELNLERRDARLGDADLERVLSTVLKKRYGLDWAPREIIAMLTRDSVLSVLAVAYDLRTTEDSIVSGGIGQHRAADLFEALVGTMRISAKLRSARFGWLYTLFGPRVFPDLTERIRRFRERLNDPAYEARLQQKRGGGWGRVKPHKPSKKGRT